MQLTNIEIFGAKEPLQKLLGEKFPVRTSYGLAKLASKLNEQFKIIEDVRNGLIKTYGEIDPENPQSIRVNPGTENFGKFAEEMDELFTQEVELVIEKVKLPLEVDGKPLEIEPSILMLLDKFIDIE